jgi:hypothetical protein
VCCSRNGIELWRGENGKGDTSYRIWMITPWSRFLDYLIQCVFADVFDHKIQDVSQLVFLSDFGTFHARWLPVEVNLMVGMGFDEPTWVMAEVEVATEARRLATRDVLVIFCKFFVMLVKVLKYLHLGMDPCLILRVAVIIQESLGDFEQFIHQR